MRIAALTLCLATAIVIVPRAASKVTVLASGAVQGALPAVTEELKRIVDRLGTTWTSGDCDGWGAFIAPDWSVIHITGATITRAQALQMCRNAAAPIASQTIDELSVRAFGDAAVVTGRNVVIAGGATPATVTLRFTDVFVRRGGRWQAVASHATRIAP